ncbi:MAG: AraC family transcriptional regulator, partial [Paenibacillus sp.]|nr:AraC family transcriptional regulator [Paenibacillus sp.]
MEDASMYRTLIVDDAYPIRISLQKSVGDCEFMIVSGLAQNGLNAIQWLKSNYADICITDIRMPKMDGLELLERIKVDYPWMVSIVVSSYDEFAYARRSIKLDAVDYILK